MNTLRKSFFRHLAQTSPAPPALEIKSAKGIYLFGSNGKKYIDLISGISVSNLGHGNAKITNAVKKQLDKHSHLMVFGEYIVSPQVEFAKLLSSALPKKLNNVYFVNSGSEAVEGALKLAKRFTGRTEIVAFKNAYHGSTHGALSVMGNETMKKAFRPLLPDVNFLDFNNEKDLERITTRTACVIVEPIQGEAGIINPCNIQPPLIPPKGGNLHVQSPSLWEGRGGLGINFLQALRKRCNEIGALLIFDEIQTGMGRTGKLFAFEHFKIIPDILCLGKALGGGMPLGAFISSKDIMHTLSENPSLGHITTFGGHPLSCVAGMESLKEIKKIQNTVKGKGELFKKLLVHPQIKEVRGMGLLLAVQFENEEENKKIISKCIEKGVITDWFLFNPSAMRIAPPLIISKKGIENSIEIILKCVDEICCS